MLSYSDNGLQYAKMQRHQDRGPQTASLNMSRSTDSGLKYVEVYRQQA